MYVLQILNFALLVSGLQDMMGKWVTITSQALKQCAEATLMLANRLLRVQTHIILSDTFVPAHTCLDLLTNAVSLIN